MFELQLCKQHNEESTLRRYRLGMFELQQVASLVSRELSMVIAWACLSCNASSLVASLPVFTGYRLGMFELQPDEKRGETQIVTGYRLGMFELQPLL